MKPNPQLLMLSINCDEYASYLTTKEYDKVKKLLLPKMEILLKFDF